MARPSATRWRSPPESPETGLLEDVLDAQELRHLGDPGADLGPRRALAPQREGEVLAHVHVRVEREQLEDEGDVALGRALSAHVLAIQENAAGGRDLEPGDHAQGRGLAAAGRAEQHEEAAVGDDEVRVAHRDEVAEALVQALEADLGHHSSGKWLTITKPIVPIRITGKEWL